MVDMGRGAYLLSGWTSQSNFGICWLDLVLLYLPRGSAAHYWGRSGRRDRTNATNSWR